MKLQTNIIQSAAVYINKYMLLLFHANLRRLKTNTAKKKKRPQTWFERAQIRFGIPKKSDFANLSGVDMNEVDENHVRGLQ